MESLKNKIFSNACMMNTAIMLCDEKKIIQKLTFKDVRDIALKMIKFLQKHVQNNNHCIGLAMEKNIYVPSLILSFQVIQCCFMFFQNEIYATIEELNIKWIISYDCNCIKHNYKLVDSLTLCNGKDMQLWERVNYIENIEILNFKGIFCVMQTSGSTGKNKIIRIPYSCIENNVISLNCYFNVTQSDVIYWGTALTFDPSLVEFLLGIFYHATLLIVPRHLAINPAYLYKSLFEVGQVTFLQIVPSLFLRFSQQQIADILLNSDLHILAFGGEYFPSDILKYPRRETLEIYNLYGVTELSCWATVFKIPPEFKSNNEVPLGKPIDDIVIELCNENEETFNTNIGEILVGSKTRYCILNNQVHSHNLTFLVKTGDLGEISGNNLFYRGRKTRIVKRFGQKLNLDNIQTVILDETSLQCRVTYSIKYRKILTFVQIDKYFDKTSKVKLLDKLRVKLLKILKEHEFPDFLDALLYLPLNSHGKISDELLEKYYEDHKESMPNENKEASDIFFDILNQYFPIDKYTNWKTLYSHTFTDLGGNSMLGMHILSDFKDQISIQIPGEFVTLLFNEPLKTCLDYLKKTKVKGKKIESSNIQKTLNINHIQPDLIHWRYDLKGCVDSAPVGFINGGSVYVCVGSFANVFVILDENGMEIYNNIFPGEIEAKPCISSCGSLIFIGCGNGTMYCLDINLKRILWEYPTQDKIRSASCLLKKSIVFGSYDSFIYCVFKDTGNLIWKVLLNGSIKTDIIYNTDLKIIYAATIKGMCYALKEDDGAMCWQYQCNGPIFSSPCIVKGDVIWASVTGTLFCISTKGDLKWKFDVNSNIFSSLINQENCLYFACHGHCFYEMTLHEDRCEVLKNIQLDGEISSTPFLYAYNNDLYAICLCNIGILYIINLRVANVIYRRSLPSESFSSPCVFKNRIYVGCRDNNLYCIDFIKAITNQ